MSGAPGGPIAVFGASGATARYLIEQATARDIPLRLHYRKPPEAAPASSAHTILVGALTSPIIVREVVRGAAATVVLFGPRSGSNDVFCAAATRVIVMAMRHHQQRRLLCVTGALIATLPSNLSVAMRATAMASRRFRSEEQADDRAEQERVVRSSHLDWTLVKPARLTDNAESANIRAGTDLDIGLRSTIARSSVAAFLLGEIESPRFVEQAAYIAGAAPR